MNGSEWNVIEKAFRPELDFMKPGHRLREDWSDDRQLTDNKIMKLFVDDEPFWLVCW